jgi:hypothetical protein
MRRPQWATARMLGARRIGARAPSEGLDAARIAVAFPGAPCACPGVSGVTNDAGGRVEPRRVAGARRSPIPTRTWARTLASGWAFRSQTFAFSRSVDGIASRGRGTTSFRQEDRGASTPCSRVRGNRGGGRIAAIRASSSSGVMMRCLARPVRGVLHAEGEASIGNTAEAIKRQRGACAVAEEAFASRPLRQYALRRGG